MVLIMVPNVCRHFWHIVTSLEAWCPQSSCTCRWLPGAFLWVSRTSHWFGTYESQSHHPCRLHLWMSEAAWSEIITRRSGIAGAQLVRFASKISRRATRWLAWHVVTSSMKGAWYAGCSSALSARTGAPQVLSRNGSNGVPRSLQTKQLK